MYNVGIANIRNMIPTKGKRNDELIKGYEKGGTIAELSLKFGISRQRVHQILKREKVDMRGRGKPRKDRFTLMCEECGKSFESLTKQRRYCSRKCSHRGLRKYKTRSERAAARKEKRLRAKERANRYYHEVFKKNPQWREIVRGRNMKGRVKGILFNAES